jgi:hypothetical protein
MARWLVALSLALAMLSSPAAAQIPDGRGSHAELVALFQRFATWRGGLTDAIGGDFSPPVLATRRAELRAMQQALGDMGVRRWTRPEKVDWLVVRARMDEAEFILDVTRPWARDPSFYTADMQRTAFTPLPVSGDQLARLTTAIDRVPFAITAAQDALTDIAADHADFALLALTRSDGIEDGYPARAKAPAGVIGWYRDLLARAERQQPALVPAIRRAIAALEAHRDWLSAKRPQITARAGVGEARLDWYLRHVLLMPYTSRDALALAQRELERFTGFYALERHRNRKLPEIALATSEADYLARLADTDARIRRFMVEQEFMTIPPAVPTDWRKLVVPPTYLEPYNVPFIQRATPPNFWEQVQFRDPSPDHWHAVIPGHRFDNLLAQAHPNPIRAKVLDGARWQGWAVYLEESALQAGFFDDRPRVRELIQLFGLWRAARSVGDIWNQLNAKTAAQVSDYWRTVTPLLDPDVARKYAHIRTTPGHGLEYTIGDIQMWALLAERKRQLGDRFVLRAFHDDFIAKGRIPIAAIRWEMTGNDAEAEALFARTPIPAAEGPAR